MREKQHTVLYRCQPMCYLYCCYCCCWYHYL